MRKDQKESLLSSLRARVWLAVCALAVINGVCGIAAFLAVSFLFSSPTVPFVAAFALSTVITVAYGKWLAGEVLRPVEKVNLAARSLERNAEAPLPTTTGSSETDGLLQSLHRNAKQFSNLMMLMESVAAGKTEMAAMPLENADRLSSAFQKLVSKVTGSIDAKNELEELRTSLNRLASDIEAASGGAHTEIRGGAEKTGQIAEAFSRLLADSSAFDQKVRSETMASKRALSAAMDRLQSLRGQETASSEPLSSLISSLKRSPDKLALLKDELSVLRSRPEEASLAEAGSRELQILGKKLNNVRGSGNELNRRIRNVREKIHQIPQASKIAEDLSRRSKMVALNASIKSSSADAGAAATLSEEFSQLSDRAVKLQRDLAGIDKTILDELSEVEALIQSILSDAADALLHSTSAGEMTSALEPLITATSGLSQKISQAAAAGEAEKEELMRQLTTLYFDKNRSTEDLAEAENLLRSAREHLDELRRTNDPPRVSEPVPTFPQLLENDEFRPPPGNEPHTAAMDLAGEN